MADTRMLNGKSVKLTAEEIAERQADKTRQADKRPMREWEMLMAESDMVDMSRDLEDHIESDHGGLTASDDLQTRYNAKKTKRADKPT